MQKVNGIVWIYSLEWRKLQLRLYILEVSKDRIIFFVEFSRVFRYRGSSAKVRDIQYCVVVVVFVISWSCLENCLSRVDEFGEYRFRERGRVEFNNNRYVEKERLFYFIFRVRFFLNWLVGVFWVSMVCFFRVLLMKIFVCFQDLVILQIQISVIYCL